MIAFFYIHKKRTVTHEGDAGSSVKAYRDPMKHNSLLVLEKTYLTHTSGSEMLARISAHTLPKNAGIHRPEGNACDAPV